MSATNEPLPQAIQAIQAALLEKFPTLKRLTPIHDPDNPYWKFILITQQNRVANFTIPDERLETQHVEAIIEEVTRNLDEFFKPTPTR